MTGTGGLQRVPRTAVEGYKIPIAPLATQQAIVAEIEAEQALVNANRELIVRFEKKDPSHPCPHLGRRSVRNTGGLKYRRRGATRRSPVRADLHVPVFVISYRHGV